MYIGIYMSRGGSYWMNRITSLILRVLMEYAEVFEI